MMRSRRAGRLGLLLPLLAAACASIPDAPGDPRDAFFARLKSMCGGQFEGRLATNEAADADFAGKPLLARGVACADDEVRIAFDVGEDRSRTWIVTRTADGVRLKHRHMLKNGSEDPLSMYGGDTVSPGRADRQEFPADAYSKALFTREGRAVSLANVWAIEMEEGTAFTYELARPGRLFRVTFDLSGPR